MSGNKRADFDDYVIGIMESDEEGAVNEDLDTDGEQLLIADLTSYSKSQKDYAIFIVTTNSKYWFFFIIFGLF